MSPEVVADHDVKNEEGYPVSKELLLLWTFRAAHQALFKDRGIRVNAVSPGRSRRRSSRSSARCWAMPASTATSRASAAPELPAISRRSCCSCARMAARWINGANIAVDGGLEASINAEVLGF